MRDSGLSIPVLLMLAAIPSHAEPPKVSDSAPEFTLQSIRGASVRLSELTRENSVVLIVLRGFPGYQCPACNRQTKEYLDSAQTFADVRAKVVLVYPGARGILQARAAEFAAGKQFPAHFELLLDPDYKLTNSYSLRWDAPNETAFPATFVIDQQGKIVFSKVSKSHGGRTNPAEVLPYLGRSTRRDH